MFEHSFFTPGWVGRVPRKSMGKSSAGKNQLGKSSTGAHPWLIQQLTADERKNPLNSGSLMPVSNCLASCHWIFSVYLFAHLLAWFWALMAVSSAPAKDIKTPRRHSTSWALYFVICNMVLDSMRWFSHHRSRAPEDRCRQNCTQAAVTLHCRRRVTSGQPHNGLVCCCVLRTAYSACIALLCIVNGDDSTFFRFFVPCDLDLCP